MEEGIRKAELECTQVKNKIKKRIKQLKVLRPKEAEISAVSCPFIIFAIYMHMFHSHSFVLSNIT